MTAWILRLPARRERHGGGGDRHRGGPARAGRRRSHPDRRRLEPCLEARAVNRRSDGSIPASSPAVASSCAGCAGTISASTRRRIRIGCSCSPTRTQISSRPWPRSTRRRRSGTQLSIRRLEILRVDSEPWQPIAFEELRRRPLRSSDEADYAVVADFTCRSRVDLQTYSGREDRLVPAPQEPAARLRPLRVRRSLHRLQHSSCPHRPRARRSSARSSSTSPPSTRSRWSTLASCSRRA